ncbi:MAG: peptide chain release factor N(5)-glutamine methyltransferase [Lishizhenia sp.]
MFVKDNSIGSLEKYFQEKLSNKFSSREIRQMFRLLVIGRLSLDDNELLIDKKQSVSESDLLFFRSSIKRLNNNEPLAHIIGYTYFYDLKILCSPAALIPRPETEELVDWVLADYDESKKLHLLDICSGTGCISLALKNKRKSWKIEGLDLSEEANTLSRQNARELNLEVEFIEGNALDLSLAANSLDCIVSNPPYIPNKDKSFMHENVLLFEPDIALFVEDSDPMLFYREIAKAAFNALKNEGNLYFEIHEEYGTATRELLLSLGYFNVVLKKDLQGKERMLKATKLI